MEKAKDKTRLLHLVDYLYQYTDEQRMKNTYEILDYLGGLGYTADRKALQDDVDTLDLQRICISTGSACDSMNTRVSHVIEAISVPDKYKNGTIRISLGKVI